MNGLVVPVFFNVRQFEHSLALHFFGTGMKTDLKPEFFNEELMI